MRKTQKLPWTVQPTALGAKRARSPSTVETVESTIDPRILENEHVTKVYDSIAPHWSGTRYKAWPKVEEFIKSQPIGTFFADVGCGNGKNMYAANKIGHTIGTDISLKLLQVANQTGNSWELVGMDILDLPFRSSFFDSVICIAVLHHISTEERRIKAISECLRITRSGGTLLFYAWAQEQVHSDNKGVSGHQFDEQDVLVPWHFKGSKDMLQTSNVNHASYDEEKSSIVFQRYCHVYTKCEWEGLFKKFGSEIVLNQFFWDTGNWAVIITKK